MSDQLPNDGTSQQDSQEVISSEVETGSGPEQSGGENPAWAPFREKLGDSPFELIKPILADMDRSANQRIESTNASLNAYKQLGSPEELGAYRNIVESMDSDPVAAYEKIGQFLKDNGRLPNAAETEVIEDEIEQEEQQEQGDPRIDQIAAQQQQITEFLQSQQFEAEVSTYQTSLQTEQEDLMAKRGYGRDDMKWILDEAVARNDAAQARGSEEFISLTQVADQYDALRNRILTAPRPGSLAPKLLPTSGGTPSAQQQKSMGQRSRGETQDIVAALLAKG